MRVGDKVKHKRNSGIAILTERYCPDQYGNDRPAWRMKYIIGSMKDVYMESDLILISSAKVDDWKKRLRR